MVVALPAACCMLVVKLSQNMSGVPGRALTVVTCGECGMDLVLDLDRIYQC